MRTTIDLYRYFSVTGELLYIGISYDAVRRLKSHMRNAGWASEITRIEIERFHSRVAAMEAETLAIKSENPRHNIKHTPVAKVSPNQPIPRDTRGLELAIERAGNQSKLARLLGVTPQYITNWMNRDGRIPVNRIVDIERATGISRVLLRPDLFPTT